MRARIGVLILGLSIILSSQVWALDGSLSWKANTEPDLAGYRVYRGTGPECAAPLTTPLPTMVAAVGKFVTFTDVNLPKLNGTICWELTAIDTAVPPHESVRSNRTSLVMVLRDCF